jgi:hypothetical protein
LAAGANTGITIAVTAAADALEMGLYDCNLSFMIAGNCSMSQEQRQVRLSVTSRSDFTLDLMVDSLDLAAMAVIWLEECSQPDWCNGIDLDKDGRVRVGDLAILGREWLVEIPSLH